MEVSCTNGKLKRRRDSSDQGTVRDVDGNDRVASPLTKCLKYTDKEGMFECTLCKQRYRRRTVYENHINNCEEERNMGDTVQRALAIAHDSV